MFKKFPICFCLHFRLEKDGQALLILLPAEEAEMIKVLFNSFVTKLFLKDTMSRSHPFRVNNRLVSVIKIEKRLKISRLAR